MQDIQINPNINTQNTLNQKSSDVFIVFTLNNPVKGINKCI